MSEEDVQNILVGLLGSACALVRRHTLALHEAAEQQHDIPCRLRVCLAVTDCFIAGQRAPGACVGW